VEEHRHYFVDPTGTDDIIIRVTITSDPPMPETYEQLWLLRRENDNKIVLNQPH
jgi:hypothetical protein